MGSICLGWLKCSNVWRKYQETCTEALITKQIGREGWERKTDEVIARVFFSSLYSFPLEENKIKENLFIKHFCSKKKIFCSYNSISFPSVFLLIHQPHDMWQILHCEFSKNSQRLCSLIVLFRKYVTNINRKTQDIVRKLILILQLKNELNILEMILSYGDIEC